MASTQMPYKQGVSELLRSIPRLRTPARLKQAVTGSNPVAPTPTRQEDRQRRSRGGPLVVRYMMLGGWAGGEVRAGWPDGSSCAHQLARNSWVLVAPVVGQTWTV